MTRKPIGDAARLLCVLAVAACRPTPAPSTESPRDAAVLAPVQPPSPTASAVGGAASTPTAEDAGPRQGPLLPGIRQLEAPFRGTRAHGFVGLTVSDAAGTHRRMTALGPRPVDEGRPVLVASLTKLFTAVAALRMVEQGGLSLDATVAELLPELAKRPWADSTLRELMSHTSRVPEFQGDGFFRRQDVDFTSLLPTLARGLARDATEKRGVYKYRNAEYALVGAILSTRAKLPVAEILAREVFLPAKMKNAGLLVGAAVPPGLDLAPMGPIRPQNFFTAGAAYASGADLLAFFEALVGSDLLSERSKAALFAGVPARGHHALGCWEYPFAKADGTTTRIVERPGSFGNVRLYTAFFPDEGRAIVAWTDDGLDIAKPHAERGIGPSLAHVAIDPPLR